MRHSVLTRGVTVTHIGEDDDGKQASENAKKVILPIREITAMIGKLIAAKCAADDYHIQLGLKKDGAQKIK